MNSQEQLKQEHSDRVAYYVDKLSLTTAQVKTLENKIIDLESQGRTVTGLDHKKNEIEKTIQLLQQEYDEKQEYLAENFTKKKQHLAEKQKEIGVANKQLSQMKMQKDKYIS
eukprot:UN32606